MDSAQPADPTPDARNTDGRAEVRQPGNPPLAHPDQGRPSSAGPSSAGPSSVGPSSAGPLQRADPVQRADPGEPAEVGEPDQVGQEGMPADVASQRRPRDIAISLLVLLVPIALMIGFGRVFLGADQPVTVDPAPAIDRARAANVFPVSQPVGLGDDWHTVSANFQGAEAGSTLRLGYVSPDGGGLQLVQSNVPFEQLLPAELTRDGQPQGPTEVGGRSWQRYSGRSSEMALVLLEPGRTVIVVGSVPENDLRRLANSLR